MGQIAADIDRRLSDLAYGLARPLRTEDSSIQIELARRLIVPSSSLFFGAMSLIFCVVIFGLLDSLPTAILMLGAIGCTLTYRISTLAVEPIAISQSDVVKILMSAIVYASSIGMVGLLCSMSESPVLIVIGGILLTGMAFGAIFTACAAPWLARLQVLIILLPFVLVLIFSNIPYMYLVSAQAPLWLYGIFLVNNTLHYQLADLIKSQQQNERLAYTDVLTRLPNRAHIMRELAGERSPPLSKPRIHYLLYFDLDGFKSINDRLGHAEGDHILAFAAGKFRDAARPSDTIARLGGDEFLAILRDVTIDDIAPIALRFIDSIAKQDSVAPPRASVGVTIGGAPLGHDYLASISAADANLYEAKRTKKGSFVLSFPQIARPRT